MIAITTFQLKIELYLYNDTYFGILTHTLMRCMGPRPRNSPGERSTEIRIAYRLKIQRVCERAKAERKREERSRRRKGRLG